MNRTLGVLALALLAAACGGGTGGGGVAPQFLTADTNGLSSGGLAPGALPAEGAADAAGDVAREVQEADLIRVDGDLLFLLNPYRGLAVVDLAKPELLGRLALQGWPIEMYVRGTRAFVLLGGFDGQGAVVDVSLADPSAPSETARAAVAGSIRTSRVVGDVLYVVTDTQALSFDLSGAVVAPVDLVDLPQGAWFVHATDELLFVASPGFSGDTDVALVDIGDPSGAMALRGSIDLPGFLTDEQKLHFGAGTLRVVTHDWNDGRISHLFVVDCANPDAPVVRGSLDLAKGEALFATRFTDDVAYVVTFEQVDPLWVIDLRDPDAPKIAGSLTVPGWSTALVPVGTKLVALGQDPANGQTTVSLFDVANPAAPALLDREDIGMGWSPASGDLKGFGVFPQDGLVLVPFQSDTSSLIVIDLQGTSITLRGAVEGAGYMTRGFPHGQAIVAVSTEEVVVADRATLVVTGRVTIAEDVVDVTRLPSGALLTLVRRGAGARCGTTDLPLSPDRMFRFGSSVAVTGWDEIGAAAYVIDLSGPSPVVSPRLDLGAFVYGPGPVPGPMPLPPGGGPDRPVFFADGAGFAGYGALGGLMTDGGLLVVRGAPSDAPDATIGAGATTDGFTVVSIPAAAVVGRIAVGGAYVTGSALDGDDLLVTTGAAWGPDDLGRPLARHDLVRVDLPTLDVSASANVPGWVVAAHDGVVFTVEETWSDAWAFDATLVALHAEGADVEVLHRLPLPSGAYDLRAAGGTLWFTSYEGGFDFGAGGSGGGVVGGGGGGAPGAPPMPDPSTGELDDLRDQWAGGEAPTILPGDDFPIPAPKTVLGTVRLSEAPVRGPDVTSDGFVSLLLPEDGSALLLRDGVVVERWDVTGPSAVQTFTADVGAWVVVAHPDTVAGQYLLALGYAGTAIVP